MKLILKFTATVLLIATIAMISCTKNRHPEILRDRPNQVVSLPITDRDYFWGQRWDTTSRGYEIHLNIARLTQEQINKGIDVRVAVYSDWDPFEKLPFDYYDYDHKDTIHLSYEAVPGNLQVIAKAPFQITYPSDVMIAYQ